MTVHRLQILHFFVSTHWSALHSGLQVKIFNLAQDLVGAEDSVIQSWALLCLAALAQLPVPVEEPPLGPASPSKKLKTGSKAPLSPWEQVWLTCLRRLSNRAIGRPAAHAASCIFRVSLDAVNAETTPLVSRVRLVSDLEILMRDLSIQGPAHPCDSVCNLFTFALELAQDDIRLHQLDLPDKLYAWLTSGSTWSPKAPSSTNNEMPDTALLFHMLVRMLSTSNVSSAPDLLWSEAQVRPRCEATRVLSEMYDSRRICNFIFEAKLPKFTPPAPASTSRGLEDTAPSQTQGPSPNLQSALATKLCLWIQRTLENQLADRPSAGKDGKPKLFSNLDALRRLLQFCVTALLFDAATARGRPQANRSLRLAAAQLLAQLVPSIGNTKWRLSERADLLATLSLLFAPVPVPTFDGVFLGLLAPTDGSGVRSDLRCKASLPPLPAGEIQSALLDQLWHSSDLADLCSPDGPIYVLCNSILTSTALATPTTTEPEPSQKRHDVFKDGSSDDDFAGPMRDAGAPLLKAGGASLLATGNASSISAVVSPDDYPLDTSLALAVSAMATLPWTQTNYGKIRHARRPVAVPSIVAAFLAASDETSLALLSAILTLVQHGLLALSTSDASDILEKVGNELLPAYAFARSDRLIEVAIQFLAATLPLWATEFADPEFQLNAQKLCDWLSDAQMEQKMPSWKVRLNFLCLMDDVGLHLHSLSILADS